MSIHFTVILDSFRIERNALVTFPTWNQIKTEMASFIRTVTSPSNYPTWRSQNNSTYHITKHTSLRTVCIYTSKSSRPTYKTNACNGTVLLSSQDKPSVYTFLFCSKRITQTTSWGNCTAMDPMRSVTCSEYINTSSNIASCDIIVSFKHLLVTTTWYDSYTYINIVMASSWMDDH